MKKPYPVLLLLVALAGIAHGQVLLSDTFSGSSVNTSNWSVSLPYADTSAPVSSGRVSLTNGAGLLSVSNYATPIEVSFSFAITGSNYESFNVYTRSDQFYPDGYAFQNGVGVSIRIQSDTGVTAGNIMLHDDGATIASGTIPLSLNTLYSARLVDTGSALTLYWGSDTSPFITATTAADYGDKVGAWNRHGAAAGSSISAGSITQIDSLTISAIPEPSTYAAIFGCVTLAGAVVWRRRHRV
jgi:hypothetical protein